MTLNMSRLADGHMSQHCDSLDSEIKFQVQQGQTLSCTPSVPQHNQAT